MSTSVSHYRNSKQRTRVLEAVQTSGIHPTAEYVFEQLRKDDPNISLGTVYRNLDILCKLGKLAKVGRTDGPEAFDSNPAPHYHLCCEKCGAVVDLPVPYMDHVDQAARKMGCKVTSHKLILSGLCPQCAGMEPLA